MGVTDHFKHRLSWLLGAEGCGANRRLPQPEGEAAGTGRGADGGWRCGRGCLQGSLPGQPSHTGVLPAPICLWALNQRGHFADWLGVRVIGFRDAFPAPEPALTQKAEKPGGSPMLGDGQIRRWYSQSRIIRQGRGNVKRREDFPAPQMFIKFYLQDTDVSRGKKNSHRPGSFSLRHDLPRHSECVPAGDGAARGTGERRGPAC